MTPSARLKTVIEVLEKIATSRVPMDTTVGDFMRHRRYIGSKDRAAIVERVYNIVRATAKLNWWLEREKLEDTAHNRVLVWLALGERPGLKAIDALYDGSQYGPKHLKEDEVKWIAATNKQLFAHPDMPDAVKVECPPLYEEKLKAYFGDDFVAEMEAFIPGATLDLRVNIWRCDLEKATDALEKDGVKTSPTPYSPWGLRAETKAYLSKAKAFVKGWVAIQDEGSQLIAVACNARPGLHVLDYCAGAGGKTLALAAAMQNKGRLVAMDLEKVRLERSRPRLKKAGVHDITELRALEDEKNRKWLRRQKGTFDLVLTDVPCTGTGTWRRNPDMRWRVYGPPLEVLVETQREILDKVAKTVKPGGRLVYATCSLLPDENEDQIAAFLERHEEFEVMKLSEAWPEGEKCPCDGDYMRLTPLRHNTDGFFAAVLRRKS